MKGREKSKGVVEGLEAGGGFRWYRYMARRREGNVPSDDRLLFRKRTACGGVYVPNQGGNGGGVRINHADGQIAIADWPVPPSTRPAVPIEDQWSLQLRADQQKVFRITIPSCSIILLHLTLGCFPLRVWQQG
jgi:hypothetical protein